MTSQDEQMRIARLEAVGAVRACLSEDEETARAVIVRSADLAELGFALAGMAASLLHLLPDAAAMQRVPDGLLRAAVS